MLKPRLWFMQIFISKFSQSSRRQLTVWILNPNGPGYYLKTNTYLRSKSYLFFDQTYINILLLSLNLLIFVNNYVLTF